jgi:3-dehydroquinate dehydratase-1
MKQVKIGNTILGQGSVKICVPVVGTKRSEIEAQTASAVKHQPDMIEFRADWYEGVFEKAMVKTMLAKIRQLVGEIPVLFTFRSRSEGGERSITWENYQELLLFVAQTGLVDAVDVELFFGYERLHGVRLSEETDASAVLSNVMQYRDDAVVLLIQQLKAAGVAVIASNHEFSKTPPVSHMVARLAKMQELGADVAKLAVMPQSAADVLALSSATLQMHEEHSATPIITMSMGALGVVSRIAGGLYGNAMTFASAGKASAPGQVEVETLRSAMRLLS